jgi:hypothetical protein
MLSKWITFFLTYYDFLPLQILPFLEPTTSDVCRQRIVHNPVDMVYDNSQVCLLHYLPLEVAFRNSLS